MELKKTKNKVYIVYFIIVMLQLLTMLYWASQKENYYIDELYSMERAVSFADRGNVSYYIQLTDDWKMNEWMSNADLKKYLIVTDEEHLLNLPFLEIIKRLFTGRGYNGLLNIVTSLFGFNIVTARPGIALNMLLFIFMEFFLIRLMNKVSMKNHSKCMALAMFGFCGFMLGMVEYIRFYCMVMLLLIMILNLFYIAWTEDSLPRIIVTDIGIFALTLLSFKHSELTIPYFGAISFCFIVGLILVVSS